MREDHKPFRGGGETCVDRYRPHIRFFSDARSSESDELLMGVVLRLIEGLTPILISLKPPTCNQVREHWSNWSHPSIN